MYYSNYVIDVCISPLISGNLGNRSARMIQKEY